MATCDHQHHHRQCANKSMTSERVLLQAALVDYAPPVQTRNPFKHNQKRPLRPSRAHAGIIQLVVRTTAVSTHVVGEETGPPPTRMFFLRFIDVRVSNEKNWPLYVLLSRTNRSLKGTSKRENDTLLREIETQGEIVALDVGPEGQWVGAELPASFEQQIFVFDPLVFASVVICKPSAARPPTVMPQVVAHGIFESYVPPEKSPEQVKAELDMLTAKMRNTVMEMESDALQDDQLDLSELQRNARELFKLFDQDKSDSIDFNEYKQMLAYRGLKLLDSKAMRLFQLVDDQKKGYIDEREFVIALYITNALRINAKKQAGALPSVLSPVDVFHQLDSDRDDLLNIFEYEKAMHLLGIEANSSAKLRDLFPKGASVINLEQFKAAWLEVIDVNEELRKRGIAARSVDDLQASKNSEKVFTLPFTKSKHKATREKVRLKNVLMEWIMQVEQEELNEALRAKEEVCSMEKARRDQAQQERRLLFAQQRQLETLTRTNEALRERKEKIQRRKERLIKERQAKEERKLLAQIAEEEAKRKLHERQAVQEHMTSKLEKIIRQKAKHADDVLDLSCGRLAELPSYVYRGKDAFNALSSLLIINLSGNRLRELPPVIFSHLFSLQILDVSDNNIEILPSEIGEARDLRILDARNNAITSLPIGICCLTALKVLTLSHNKLVHFGDIPRSDSLFRDSYCAGLSALEELDLSYNTELVSISDAIGELQHLQVFRIRGCISLKRLPDAFQKLVSLVIFDISMSHQKRFGRHVFGGDLRSLRTIDLSFNCIVALPEALGELTALQELKVSHNALASFQDHLAMLVELVVFKASNNKIEALPQSIGQLTNLEVLDLSRNLLDSPIPPTMGLLTSLHCLDLQHNQLTEIPMEFGALLNIRELNLAWNKLSCLPDEMGCMVSLKKLHLAHNCFASLPDSIMLWQDLELLDISHNVLVTPLTPFIAKLSSLAYFDVSMNKLTQLEACIYNLPSVQVLNMSGNKLSRLPVELVSAPIASSLKKMDLYNNKIVAIPVEWTSLLSSLDVFSIGKNPMSLLPEKWSDHWRDGRWQRGCVHATASMQGYTPAQVVEWVHDRSAVYPQLVTVWKERQPFTGSDDFVNQVREAVVSNEIGGSMWQHRFERIVRHYYYEFKYLGHEIAMHSIDETQQARFAIQEARLREEQNLRADAAVEKNEAFREQLRAYSFNQDAHRTSMEKRRRRHEAQLLVNIQAETRQWNEVISMKLPMVEDRHEMIVRERKKRFADDMKMIARQRAQEKTVNERLE